MMQLRFRCRRVLAAVAALESRAGAGYAGPIEVIFSKIPGHPTAVVPGVLDLNGQPTTSDWRALEDLRMSPDGSLWIIKGRNQLGSDLETILVLGSGTTAIGNFAQEGQPIPGGARELFDFFGSGTGQFNTMNDFAYSARARGGLASVFQKVIKWNGVAQTVVYQMGDLYTGLQDLAPNPSGDETVGNSIGSIHILDDGTIGSQDSTILNIHTSRRPALAYNLAGFQQTGVTTVNALGGLGAQVWNTIDANEFYTTPDNEHWLAEGRIVNPGGSALKVLVLDGNAVLQEGQEVAGSGLILGDVFQNVLLSTGDWLSRGRDNTSSAQPDWAVHNGALIAKTGDPIFPGSSENWTDVLFSVTGNRVGDYVVGGTTTGDAASNDVLVLNGTEVVVREGDPVDLNGNGLPDDDAFIGRGNNGGAFVAVSSYLTDDGMLYFLANLRDGAGNDLNSNPAFSTPAAFLRINLASSPPCAGDRGDANCDGTIDFFDIDPFIAALFDQANYLATYCNGSLCAVDMNCDGVVDFFDIDGFVDCVFGNCAPCP